MAPLSAFTMSLHQMIHLDRKSHTPIYRQISGILREAIRSGQLKEGTRLPTERALAQTLAVNRTTVMNAYNELRSEGLIEGHVGRGTLVKQRFSSLADGWENRQATWLSHLAPIEASALNSDTRILHDFAQFPDQAGFISFALNFPALDLVPTYQFQQIVQEKLASNAARALSYTPVEGLIELRQAIVAHMQSRQVPLNLAQVFVISGSTQGIGLLGRILLQPGDVVFVETPTYLGAIHTFEALGARIIHIPVDSEGIRVDVLETLLHRYQPKLLYTMPTFQNPTGVVMSLERKRRLLSLAHRFQFPILEDDAYGEIYYGATQPQPLKAMDTRGHVIYLSTFSKTVAPGLRVAWLGAPEQIIGHLSRHNQIFDMNPNALGQWLLAEFMRCGNYERHLASIRQIYRQKRDTMIQAIERYWSVDYRLKTPEGGFHLWVRLPHGIRARQFLREASSERVAFVIGDPFYLDGGGEHFLRLSFGAPRLEQIEEGIQRLGSLLTRLQKE